MYSYRWSIERIDGYPELNNLKSVVSTVYWELEIRDNTDLSIHYIREGTQLSAPNPDTFVDHLELSNEDILEWVWQIIGKDTTEERIRTELDEMRQPSMPTEQTLPMPWIGSCCPDGKLIDQQSIVTVSE
jgi:hypothetical protein